MSCTVTSAMNTSLARCTPWQVLEKSTTALQWHQRDEAGQWLISDIEDSGTLELNCPGMAVTVTLDDIYEDVKLA